MGNRLNNNPKIVDTTDTHVPGPLSINCIKWVGTEAKPIIPDNDLHIRTGARLTGKGQLSISARAQALNDEADEVSQEGYSAYFGKPGWLLGPDGLFVEDIDGGELQIFLN